MITSYADYRATADNYVATLCFGGKAQLTGLWVADKDMLQYVKQDPACLIGFLSLDPTQPSWKDEMRYGHQELGRRGVKLLPMYAGLFPKTPLSIPYGFTRTETIYPCFSTQAQPLNQKAKLKLPCAATLMLYHDAVRTCAL